MRKEVEWRMTVYVTYWQEYDDVEICGVYQHKADAERAVDEWYKNTYSMDGGVFYEAVEFNKGSVPDEQATKDTPDGGGKAKE